MDDENMEHWYVIEEIISRDPPRGLLFLLFVLPFWLFEKLTSKKRKEVEDEDLADEVQE